MAKEIIADELGAVIFDNTTGEAHSPVITPPNCPRSEISNRLMAKLTREIYINKNCITMEEAYSMASQRVDGSEKNLRKLIEEEI